MMTLNHLMLHVTPFWHNKFQTPERFSLPWLGNISGTWTALGRRTRRRWWRRGLWTRRGHLVCRDHGDHRRHPRTAHGAFYTSVAKKLKYYSGVHLTSVGMKTVALPVRGGVEWLMVCGVSLKHWGCSREQSLDCIPSDSSPAPSSVWRWPGENTDTCGPLNK